MSAPDRLRQAIDDEQRRLLTTVPTAREAALLSLIRVIDRIPHAPGIDPLPDLITGHRLPAIGAGLALRLCLASTGGSEDSAAGVDAWAIGFLSACARLAEAGLVLAQVDAGAMRLVEEGAGRFDVWWATKAPPPAWRERADIDWWAGWQARHGATSLGQPTGGDRERDHGYETDAAARVEAMSYQLGYPPEAVLGGIAVGTWRDILRELIAMALRPRDGSEAPEWYSTRSLADTVADRLGIAPEMTRAALDVLALDTEAAACHAAVPGVALAPLVHLDRGRVALSSYGLLAEPLFYLTRELRRRDPEGYHNVSWHREAVFRQDLYALFGDRRFAVSADRIKLRRVDGNVRTDIDAAIFDRKTGTLGIFELKSQDPFARSAAELARQRDNVLYANRQVAGVLDWLNRHGGDEILNRLDWTVAKRFRVQKVYPFVLGRYIVQFGDGPVPDRRAAWGTWPQVLRLLEAQPFGLKEANPIASLHARLVRDAPSLPSPADMPSREIDVGAARLSVWPSHAAYRAGRSSGGPAAGGHEPGGV